MSVSSRSFRKVIHLRNPIEKLSIEAEIADIIIEPHEDPNIIIYGYAYGGETPLCEAVNLDDQILVKLTKGRSEGRLYTVKAKIIVPPNKIREEVSIKTNIGDIRIDGLPTKKLDLSTLNGDILLGGIDSEDIVVNTSNGDILLRGGKYNKATLSTVNGDIRIEILMLRGYELTASTNRGKIKLGIPVDSSVEISLSTVKGSVSIGKRERFRLVEKKDREYRLVSGDGEAKISLKAIDGDISVNLLKEIAGGS